MKIILTDNTRGHQISAEVDDDNWVSAAIDCAWHWLHHHGFDSVTARELNLAEGNPRIATVACEIHDE